MQRNTLLISLFLCFFMTTNTYCEQGYVKDLSLGLGLINEHIGTYQLNTSGEKNEFEHRVVAEGGLTYISPWDNFVVPLAAGFQFPKSTEESAITKYNFYLTAHLGHYIIPELLIRLGTTYYLTHYSSDGGTSNLRNGNGYTDFPLPTESSTAANFTTDVAIQYFYANYSVKGHLMVFNALDTLKRSYTYAITLNHHFGTSLWQ